MATPDPKELATKPAGADQIAHAEMIVASSPKRKGSKMGSINVTNCLGANVTVKITINGNNTIIAGRDVPINGTINSIPIATTASEFTGIAIIVMLNEWAYVVDLNRGHYFGDNNGAYPGSEYEITFILMGLYGSGSSEMGFMQAYREVDSGTVFTYCNDQKNLHHY